jgi:hypothetical protein
LLATAIDGVLANQKALKAAEVEMSKKENEKKRQFSGSHEDESMKRPKGDELGGEMDLVLDKVTNQQEEQNLRSKEVAQDSANTSMADQTRGEGNIEGDEDIGSTSTKGLDPGQFINEEAYCPSSPARSKKIPDLSVILNSPVFHSKASKTHK